MTISPWVLRGFLVAGVIATPVVFGAAGQGPAAGKATAAAQKGGLDETGPYDPVENWFKPGFDRWGQPVLGSAVDTPNRIIVVAGREGSGRQGSAAIGALGELMKEKPARARGEIPEAAAANIHHVLVLNGDGKVVEEWTQWNSRLAFAHSVAIDPNDPERHVWVIDRDNNQILKMTNDGKKIVMELGEKGVMGTDQKHFGFPANIKFLADGSFFVADGYRNSRVIKFDKNGNFLMEFGKKGTGPGEFNLVHDMAVDARGRIYVADRNNNRVQVFDAAGKFLEEWDDIRSPASIFVSKDQNVWVGSAGSVRVAKYDLNGKLLTYWGVSGSFPGGLSNPHSMEVDAAGNLYVSDAWSNRLLKFTPKKNADRSRLLQIR